MFSKSCESNVENNFKINIIYGINVTSTRCQMNNPNFKVAVFDTKPYDRQFFDEANKNYGYSITYFEEKLRPQTAKLTIGYDAICAFVNDNLNADVINCLHDNGVKLIAMRCTGYNNVDLISACKANIPVVHVPHYSPNAIAEYSLALLMTLNRKINHAYNRVRDGNFSINGFIGFDLCNKTIGVIGTGKIGKTFIKLLQGFDVNIIAYDIYPDIDFAKKFNVEYVTLDELFKRSEIISLYCPLTTQNTHMINDDTIKQMKDGVVIINTSRGKLIDSNSLINGLKSGKISAAGLDVYEEETDYFFEDKSDTIITDDILARLMTFKNVIITSHQAFFTKEAVHNIVNTVMVSIDKFINQKQLDNIININCLLKKHV